MSHLPVLYHEIIHAIRPHDEGLYVDGTVGAGGHAWGLLNESSPNGKLLGLDIDPEAIEISRNRLKEFGGRVYLQRVSYTSLRSQLELLGWSWVDGILLDLGVSSMQLDTVDRGFSFRKDASLDMRFDPDGNTTAFDLVNKLPERDLADIIYKFGEEKKSRQIARKIVNKRPIESTLQLANVIEKVIQPRRGKIHPATRTFQALRIATNNELKALETVLPQAVRALTSGGRLAVISFHSLEDRIVKQFFQRESRDCICPPKQPVCNCGHTALIKLVTPKLIRPKEEEIYRNPRSRSSRLRVAEKV